MRKIEIKNDKLAKLLEERAEVFKKVGEINEQLVALDAERKKLAYKMDRLKDKVKPFIDKLEPTFELKEFEIITNVHLNSKKFPEVEIVDRLEEYANALREEAKAKNDASK